MLAAYYDINKIEVGVDEAGRGCYAGAVFAAAVILPKDFYHPLLNDSKQMNAVNRNILREVIEQESLAYAVASVDSAEIDRINILQASFKAMHLSIDQLMHPFDCLLIDGNRFKPYKKIPHQTIIRGDGKYASIAAASVLAKTYRDEYMQKLDLECPQYDWKNNKGYGTASHRLAIATHGLTDYHRKSFKIHPAAVLEEE